MSNNKYCFECGEEEPNFEVNGYKRNCLDCGGTGSVLQVTEMVDLVNDLRLRGLLPESLAENVVDEDFSVPELDFDNDDIDLDFEDIDYDDNY